jgi:glycosyltransferase involved in cell wall biosynthesis
MLEAMSAGCLVVGSRTQPVEEVLVDGVNGILVDFFAPDQVADRVIDALRNADAHRNLRAAARQTIREKYDLKRVCLPAQINLLSHLLN